MVFYVTQIHACHTMQKFGKPFISFCHRSAKFIAVYIKVIKQPCKAAFGRGPLCRRFDIVEHTLQSFVQIFIIVRCRIHIEKQFRRQNKKAFFFHQTFAGFFCICIAHFRIVKFCISCILFTSIDIVCEIFGDITIKHSTQHIVLEIPAIHSPSQFIGDCPDGAM